MYLKLYILYILIIFGRPQLIFWYIERKPQFCHTSVYALLYLNRTHLHPQLKALNSHKYEHFPKKKFVLFLLLFVFSVYLVFKFYVFWLNYIFVFRLNYLFCFFDFLLLFFFVYLLVNFFGLWFKARETSSRNKSTLELTREETRKLLIQLISKQAKVRQLDKLFELRVGSRTRQSNLLV